MTITDYTTLQTTVEDWTKRSDMTSRVPLFVQMAESQMNMRLRLRVMETSTTLTLSSGANSITLPSGFLEPVSLVYATLDGPVQVDRASLDDRRDTADTSGRPKYFAYGATTVDFERTADQDYSLNFRYLKKLDLATDNSNAVLLKAPFAYLYGALAAYARWIQDPEQLSAYTALFEQQLDALDKDDSQSRGSAPLRTEFPAVLGSYVWDINEG